MTGKDIKYLMRIHGVTLRELKNRMGITLKRIRYVREKGLTNPHVIRDWISGITGSDPGLLGPVGSPIG